MNDDLKTQLTAWALDELPADERSAVEAHLTVLPEAKAYAEETREFCTLLTETLGASTETTLTPDQRAELARQFRTPTESVVRFRPAAAVAWVIGLGAVAAALVMWAGGFMAPRPDVVAMGSTAAAPESARTSTTESDSDPTSLFSTAYADVDDKTERFGLRRELAKEEKVELAKRSSFAENAPSEATSTVERLANFGANPAPPSDAPADLLAATQGLGSTADADKATDLSLNVQLEDRSKVVEALVKTRIAGEASSASGPATLAQATAAVPAAPAPAETAEGLRTKLKSDFGDTNSPQQALLAGVGGGTAGGAPSPSVNRGLARPRATRGFDTEVEFKVAEDKLQDESGRGGLAGTSSRDEGLSQLKAAGGLVAEQPAKPITSFWAAEPGSYYKLNEQTSDHYFRYVTPRPAQPTAEAYAAVPENPFKAVAAEPLSTFSIDVDTAGYANVRRFLNQGQRPPQPAVRIEEMVNYFRYDYPQPEAGKPFSVIVDLADCPWQPQHRLARVGLKGREIATDKRPNSNLVFLIDVSGSMDEPNKLPLVQQSLRMLSSQLSERDRVAMVTYAGESGLALDSTNGADRAKISAAIDKLSPGGSTNGASGIQLAYQVAQHNFVKEGVNRVLLATDGDFNVGVTSQEELQKLITDRAKSGVFLSVLGYGMGNLKDSTMEMLADKGNGNYAYIDSLSEARKVLSEEMSGTLVTIAKDVKIQIEFNPAVVRGYRLLGYENRMLAKQDFNDDKKDAGEIGAGHTVTALYELVPVGTPPDVPPVDGLKYSPQPIVATATPVDARKPLDPAIARETMTVKLRYKAPDGETSQLIEVPVVDKEAKFVESPADFKFAASVTMFGMLLKDSAHKGNASWDQVRQFALQGKGPDPLGYRGEFIQLVEKARGLVP